MGLAGGATSMASQHPKNLGPSHIAAKPSRRKLGLLGRCRNVLRRNSVQHPVVHLAAQILVGPAGPRSQGFHLSLWGSSGTAAPPARLHCGELLGILGLPRLDVLCKLSPDVFLSGDQANVMSLAQGNQPTGFYSYKAFQDWATHDESHPEASLWG